jgi:S-adenosylmethionine:tRNA ribosyltransferase-isomerase
LGPGDRLEFAPKSPGFATAMAEVESNLGNGEILLRFEHESDLRLDVYGDTPLPPYIRRPLADAERYQTIFGTVPGSAAAPTAGLHFTDSVVNRLRHRGVSVAEITLHIGLDTFRPVTQALLGDHQIHREWCEVSAETASEIAACRARGGRVIAIGTTAARTLETLGRAWNGEPPGGFIGYTDLFIRPGHRWRLVDALLTNFHLPRSTLIMLVSAFAGRELVLKAYHEAMRCEYRFYSFGDAMLIR